MFDEERENEAETEMVFDIVDVTEALGVLEELGIILHVDDAGDCRFQCFRVHSAIVTFWDLAIEMGIFVQGSTYSKAPPVQPDSMPWDLRDKPSSKFLMVAPEHKAKFVHQWYSTLAVYTALAQQSAERRSRREPSICLMHLLHALVHRQLPLVTKAIVLAYSWPCRSWTQYPQPEHFAGLLTHGHDVWLDALRSLLPSKARLELFQLCLDHSSVPLDPVTRSLYSVIVADAISTRSAENVAGALAWIEPVLLLADSLPRWLSGLVYLRAGIYTEKSGRIDDAKKFYTKVLEYAPESPITASPSNYRDVRHAFIEAEALLHISQLARDPSTALATLHPCREILLRIRHYHHESLLVNEILRRRMTIAHDITSPTLSLDNLILDPSCEIVCLGLLGQAHTKLGEWPEAVVVYQSGLDLCNELFDIKGMADMSFSLGNAFFMMLDAKKAVEYHEKALELAKSLGNVALNARIDYALGQARLELREYSAAVNHVEAARRGFKLAKDEQGHARSLWLMGKLHTAKGAIEGPMMYQMAKELFKQSVEITPDPSCKVDCYHALGELCEKTGEIEIAVEWYGKCADNCGPGHIATELNAKTRKQILENQMKGNVIISGVLLKKKQKSMFNPWPRRFMKLTPQTLTYGPTDDFSEAKQMQVRDILDVVEKGEVEFDLDVIRVDGENTTRRTIHLKATSHDEMRAWVEAISSTIRSHS